VTSRRCHLLVEGQTEEIFANQVLMPHLHAVGFDVVTVSIVATKRVASGAKFRGGITSWNQLQADLRLLLRDSAMVVSTLIDFYALPPETPGASTSRMPPRERVVDIENAIAADLGAENLVPHVMLHEFETLLFVDPARVAQHFGDDHIQQGMQADITHCGGEPELIDDGPQTAPSKRLRNHISTYSKTTDGPTIVAGIGLAPLRQACPHFDAWLNELERRALP
jgi:hypothetical protein